MIQWPWHRQIAAKIISSDFTLNLTPRKLDRPPDANVNAPAQLNLAVPHALTTPNPYPSPSNRPISPHVYYLVNTGMSFQGLCLLSLVALDERKEGEPENAPLMGRYPWLLSGAVRAAGAAARL